MLKLPTTSLHTKLALLLIAFALVPALCLTWGVWRALDQALDFWSNPGMQSSFNGSVVTAREAVRLLETRLLADVTLSGSDAEPPPGLQIWRLFEWSESGYVLSEAEPSRAGTLLSDSDIEEALIEGARRVVRHDAGYLLAVVPVDEEQRRVRVGGYRVSPEFFEGIAEARQGARLFGRIAAYENVSRSWIWVSLAALVLAVGVASTLLARRLARGVTRPIEDMVGAMQSLGRDESVPPLAPPRDREMGYLIRSFNAMADELARSRRAIKRAERLSAWQDVARRVAHEIKNPLTPIQFAIHRLRKRLAGDADTATTESLDSILGEVETLKSIADTFSSLAKLPEPTMAPLDVGKLLQEVVSLYGSPDVDLRLDIDVALPDTMGDRKQLRQVFNNIIQNAHDAMAGHGSLTVEARQRDGHIHIAVTDSGPGVDASIAERIWEPYFTTKTTGSGIGLPVVSKIVGDHRGTIEIDNAEQGGAVVTLTLPVKAASSPSGTGSGSLRLAAGAVALLLLALPAPSPAAPAPSSIHPQDLLDTIERLLPESWVIAEQDDGGEPFLWTSDTPTWAVKLEDQSLQIHHPKGFTYHPFVRLHFCPPDWSGEMLEHDYYGTREPAFLLGDSASFRVLYHKAGWIRWDGALEQLAGALGVATVDISRDVKAEIDHTLIGPFQQRVVTTASDLRKDIMDRVMGLSRGGEVLYLEYVASVSRPEPTPGAPSLASPIRALIDEETSRLATHVFHTFPDVRTVYLRRLCDNRMFDRIVERDPSRGAVTSVRTTGAP